MSKVKIPDSHLGIVLGKRDKVVHILLSEITCLTQWYYKTDSYDGREGIKIALESLENLLKAIGFMDTELSDGDYTLFKKFIYNG